MKLLPGYVARNDFIRTRLEIQSSTKPELDYHNGGGSGALPAPGAPGAQLSLNVRNIY